MGRIGSSSALGFTLALALAFAAAGPLAAQQGGIAAPAMESDPNLKPEDQLAPSQMMQAMPAAVSEPSGAPAKPAHPAMHAQAATPAAVPAAPRAAPPKPAPVGPRVAACSGIFGKDSSHLRLAMTYDSKNIIFTDVDANGGAKVEASVLFPNDPTRRLEVWWSNPAARSGTYLIVINGKSTWVAPAACG